MGSVAEICHRKEPRYKVCDGQMLECETYLDGSELRGGTVVDVSSTGMRMLVSGRFSVGQTLATELKTDRSHGLFRGIVRRIEPWVNGQSILGCQLLDSIPASVLEELSNAGIVNRRCDERTAWEQPATMNWELHPGEVDIQIRDYSQGGMRIYCEEAFPENVRLRIRLNTADQDQVIVEATSIWREESEGGAEAGLQFTRSDSSRVIENLQQSDKVTSEPSEPDRVRATIRITIAATAAMILLAIAAVEVAPQFTLGLIQRLF